MRLLPSHLERTVLILSYHMQFESHQHANITSKPTELVDPTSSFATVLHLDVWLGYTLTPAISEGTKNPRLDLSFDTILWDYE